MRQKRIDRRNNYFRIKAEEDMKKTFEYKFKKFAVLAKSFATQSRDDRLRELLPGSAEAEQDNNIVRTTDDLSELLEEGDRIQVGEEKFCVLEVGGDVITPSSVPLNIEYKGESDVGLSLYKLPRIDGVYRVFHNIREKIKQSGAIRKVVSKLKSARDLITKSKQFQQISSKIKEQKNKLTESNVFQKVQSKALSITNKVKTKVAEVKNTFDEAPGADTAKDDSNHTHGYPNSVFDQYSDQYSEGYSDQYSDGVAPYVAADSEPTDYDGSSSPSPGSYNATRGGYDESNAAVYAGAGEYEGSYARVYIDPTDP